MLALGVVKHAVLGALMASATVFIARELGYRDWSVWLYYILWPAYLSVYCAPDAQRWIEQFSAESEENLVQWKRSWAERQAQREPQKTAKRERKAAEQAQREERKAAERRRKATKQAHHEHNKMIERQRKAAEQVRRRMIGDWVLEGREAVDETEYWLRSQCTQEDHAELGRYINEMRVRQGLQALNLTHPRTLAFAFVENRDWAFATDPEFRAAIQPEEVPPPQPKQRETGSVAGAVLWYLAYKQMKGEGSEGVEKVKRAATGHGLKDWFNRCS